jgi:predicted nucleic acid-binding protein
MIAFFDTSVYVSLFRGLVHKEEPLGAAEGCVLRLSPIVASELLRAAKPESRRRVEDLVASLLPIEPPSWRRSWLEAGRVLPRVFPDHDEVGISRLQNDCLLALTARHNGAILIAADRHFEELAHALHFQLKLLPASQS